MMATQIVPHYCATTTDVKHLMIRFHGKDPIEQKDLQSRYNAGADRDLYYISRTKGLIRGIC